MLVFQSDPHHPCSINKYVYTFSEVNLNVPIKMANLVSLFGYLNYLNFFFLTLCVVCSHSLTLNVHCMYYRT